MPRREHPDRALSRALQEEARRVKTQAGRRRLVEPVVNVGVPDADRIAFPAGVVSDRRGARDPALRADLLTRALERLGDPHRQVVWLARSGALSVGEPDLLWRAAARTAFARFDGNQPDRRVCFVVTRLGWLDLEDESRRTWPRLRPSHEPTPGPPRLDVEGVWAITR